MSSRVLDHRMWRQDMFHNLSKPTSTYSRYELNFHRPKSWISESLKPASFADVAAHPSKRVKLYYANLIPAWIHVKMNNQKLLMRLEEYEGMSLFSVELLVEKIDLHQNNESRL